MWKGTSKGDGWDEADTGVAPGCDDSNSDSEDDVMLEDAIPEDVVQELTNTSQDLSLLSEAGIIHHEISSDLSIHHQHSLRYHKLRSRY